ncbi:MAG: autotransporter assembly complex protein TamA [Deltaproteobacteria bacterium]|nr:autotransporter assembly complex protein TamA [Deltaproteobacteria bacterium]
MIRGKPLLAVLLLLLTGVVASPLSAAERVEIAVSGIEGDALKNVRESLTLPAGLVREGTVDRQWLERFREQAESLTRTALEPFGYYRAGVTATIEDGAPEEVRLRVVVAPGDPVRLTEVSVLLHGQGAQEIRLRTLVAAFPLDKGDILVQPRYEEAKDALFFLAQELGYLDADFTIHEIRIAQARDTATLRLEMETGRRYFFNGTRIEGAPGYPEAFLRRHLTYHPGAPFSQAQLGETQLNFVNSERFSEVTVTPEKEKALDFHVPVLVTLNPSPSKTLRQGIGYGTDTGARFNLRYRDLNVLDRGHEFYSNLYLSERLQGLAAGYTLPDATDVRNSTTLQFNMQRTDVTTYTSNIVALEIDRNNSFGAGKLGTAYLKLQREQYTIGTQDSGAFLVLPGVRYSENRYDNPSRPVRGFRFALDLRGTHRWLGSDMGLIQGSAEGSFLLPLPGRFSFAARGKVGLTFLGDPLNELPPSLRFFAGGDQSVRGYAYQSLGPRDASGQVVGGKHLLVGAVELERAFLESWGVCAFYDAGNAFDSFAELRAAQGAGVGLRYYTPVGALSLYLARQIGQEDPGLRIHFTVGFEL